jgi:thioredoxin 1
MRSVIALCAEWCGVCREFRGAFDAAARSMPESRFSWVDIESRAETEDLDLETLPTLLVVDGERSIRFFGPVLPRASAIEQLVRGLDHEGAPAAIPDQDRASIDALVASLCNV